LSCFVDTHCHLHLIKEKFGGEVTIKSIIDAAANAKVEKLLTVSGSLQDLRQIVALSEKNENVFGALGVHPHDATNMKEADFQYICEFCNHPKISAIGEIGLDYYYEYSPRGLQKEVFIRFLELAIKINMPVVIHTRDAEDDTIEILKQYGANLKGVVHCFTGSLALAEYIIENCPQLCLGFTGVITFKNAEKIREVVKATPIERIFVETDSPFMAPEPFRGKTNQPAYIPFVLSKIAAIKNLSEEQVLRITNENCAYIFQDQTINAN
jgi:TatD DNase family protein